MALHGNDELARKGSGFYIRAQKAQTEGQKAEDVRRLVNLTHNAAIDMCIAELAAYADGESLKRNKLIFNMNALKVQTVKL